MDIETKQENTNFFRLCMFYVASFLNIYPIFIYLMRIYYYLFLFLCVLIDDIGQARVVIKKLKQTASTLNLNNSNSNRASMIELNTVNLHVKIDNNNNNSNNNNNNSIKFNNRKFEQDKVMPSIDEYEGGNDSNTGQSPSDHDFQSNPLHQQHS